MRTLRRYYREAWVVDCEFTAPQGERPRPLCVVGRELFTGRYVRQWLPGAAPPRPPFAVGIDALFISYYASAELGCCLALNWPMPSRMVDLYAEFRCQTSGLPVPCGHSLLGALTYYGIDGIGASEKASMRQLAMRGGPYTASEQRALLDYCQSDVDALVQLLLVMLPRLDLPRALLRGRYMAAAARIEWTGIPIDTDTLARLRTHWDTIRTRLVAAVDHEYGVFVPTGQRPITAETRLGRALLETATLWHIDPYALAEAVEHVWQEQRGLYAESVAARRQARRATGLIAERINRWEDGGHDFSSWPGLDETAQELAGLLPGLGMGPGYADGGYDDTDYAGQLWEVLREHDDRMPPRQDPAILRQAAELVASYPEEAGRYTGPVTFSTQRFHDYLAGAGIPWPHLDSGALALDDDTFREMARAYPAQIGPLRELRYALSQLRLSSLAVGSDGRNRCLLSAFGSKSSRNQPSNSRYIFGPSCWLRSLIKPGAWPSGRIRRLVATRVGHCGAAVGGSSHDRRLPVRRFLLDVRSDGRCRSLYRNEGNTCGHTGSIQNCGARRPLWPFGPRSGPKAWDPLVSRQRTFTAPQRGIPTILALGRARRGGGHVNRTAPHRVWLAAAYGSTGHPALAAEFPHAGQRRGNDAPGLLPGDRAGDFGMCCSARCVAGGGEHSRHRRHGRAYAGGHAGSE